MKIIHIDSLPVTYDIDEIIDSSMENGEMDAEFHYLADYRNAKTLRDLLERVCERLGFSSSKISRIILVADELNNNAIGHGSSVGGINIMRIKTGLYKEERMFILEVQDNGKGASPKTALDMETMRAHKLKRGYGKHDSIRGRGLFLITVQIVDRLYFKNADDGGLIVGIRIAL